MVLDDTIAAVASGSGVVPWGGARALVRVSGPGVGAIVCDGPLGTAEREGVVDREGVALGARFELGVRVELESGVGVGVDARRRGVACRAMLELLPRDSVRVLGRGLGHESVRAIGEASAVRWLRVPVLAIYRAGPATYTGQRTLELLIPGGRALVRRVVEALCAVPGVRAAGPGEFSARAYASGRLSLCQAEGVAAVIAAENADELLAARALLAGQRGGVYRAWAESLAALLALVEAGIDFADAEGVVAIARDRLLGELAEVADSIDRESGARGGVISDARRPLVLIAGAPNAGKSTLLNALCRALGGQGGAAMWPGAVESSVAGSTRDVLTREVMIPGPTAGRSPVCAVLADSPGFELTGVELAGVGLAGIGSQYASDATAAAWQRADLVLWCRAAETLGATERSHAQGMLVGEFGTIDGGDARCVRVITKTDRLSGHAHAERGAGANGAAGVEPHAEMLVCAPSGAGLERLLAVIYSRLAGGDGCVSQGWRGEASVLPRHRAALSVARSGLERAADLERESAGRELVASELRSALDALGELTGAVTPDDVLGRVFASFCIGK